jgi:diguanylate cyclase (GGDEF)-like protein
MALAQARRDRTLVAVLQLDLDRFKDVNDTLGHAAGDHLLCAIAHRLHTAVRETDTVARMGGDEFVVIVTALHSIGEAARLAEKLVALVAEPTPYSDTTLYTSTSVGITIYPHDDVEPEQLLRNADIALYQAKERGRNTYSFFVGEMKERITRRKRLESELRRALAAEEIDVFSQPQVELRSDRIASVEALVRWRHPNLGLLLPSTFIDVAEESGLIAPLGEIVLHRALQQMRIWTDLDIAPERVAVNLSEAQFRRQDIAQVAREALACSGLEPGRLELEVTEGVILSRRQDEVISAIERLHALGVSLALDDFGTGYASLTHLNRFSFRRLKIDRSFVRDIGHDPGDAVIVRTVINLGHSLGYEVTAEGVENEEQLAYLRLHGCDLVQGYLFAPPMTSDALGALLRSGRIEWPAANRYGAPRVPSPDAAVELASLSPSG